MTYEPSETGRERQNKVCKTDNELCRLQVHILEIFKNPVNNTRIHYGEFNLVFDKPAVVDNKNKQYYTLYLCV